MVACYKKAFLEVRITKEKIEIIKKEIKDEKDTVNSFKDCFIGLKNNGFEKFLKNYFYVDFEQNSYLISCKSDIKDVPYLCVLRLKKFLNLKDITFIHVENKTFYKLEIQNQKFSFLKTKNESFSINTQNIVLSCAYEDFDTLKSFQEKKNINPVNILNLESYFIISFGNALKELYKDLSIKKKFDIKSININKKILKDPLFISIFILFLGFYINYFFYSFAENDIISEENKIFSERFPNVQVLDPYEQAKSIIRTNKENVLNLLDKAFSSLPKGSTIFEISYENKSLTVRAKAKKDKIQNLKNIQNIKELPDGYEEFTEIFK